MQRIRIWAWGFAAALAIGASFAPTANAASGFAIPPADGTAGITAPEGGARYFLLGRRGVNLAVKVGTEGPAIQRAVPGGFSIPGVTLKGAPGGLADDGRTLTLSNFSNAFLERSEFLLLRTRDLAIAERIDLKGSFVFDAMSPDGGLLYLVHLVDRRNPLDYEVRVYDVDAGRLLPDPVVDPSEPDEQMGGYPYARATSPDGRWAYTLYDGGEEPFIHALDTVDRTAVCIDLDEAGLPIGRGSTLTAADDGGTLLIGGRGTTLASVETGSWEVSVPAAAGETATPDGDSDQGSAAPRVVIGLAVLALIVAAALALAARTRRRAAWVSHSPQAGGSASSPSAASESTNASASERAREGSIP